MILHIDMDAFYASVEQLDNPSLVGKPVIVGWDSNRGVVTTASYEARKFGVHSAMPMFLAKQKCPQAIIVPGRMGRYKEISGMVMNILKDFSPLVEQVSIDEAYVDIRGCDLIHGDCREIALKIKQRVKVSVGLTCSIGAAPVKFLAKIASDLQKPDGLTIITEEDMPAFIEQLPVQKISGVGKTTFSMLKQLGINTLGDVGRYPSKQLVQRLGKFGIRLVELSQGRDDSPVEPYTPTKSISAENTLPENTLDAELLKTELLRHAERVGRELREEGLRARTVTLKIKHADFKIVSRSATLKRPLQSSETLYKEILKLFDAYPLGQPVRLIGVGVSGLVDARRPVQLELFDRTTAPDPRWEKVDQALDLITKKYGKTSVQKGRLVAKQDKVETDKKP